VIAGRLVTARVVDVESGELTAVDRTEDCAEESEAVWAPQTSIEAIIRISPGIQLVDAGVFMKFASQSLVVIYATQFNGLTQVIPAVFNICLAKTMTATDRPPECTVSQLMKEKCWPGNQRFAKPTDDLPWLPRNGGVANPNHQSALQGDQFVLVGEAQSHHRPAGGGGGNPGIASMRNPTHYVGRMEGESASRHVPGVIPRLRCQEITQSAADYLMSLFPTHADAQGINGLAGGVIVALVSR